LLQILAYQFPVGALGEARAQPPHPFEPGLEARLRFVAFGVPRLEIVEQGADSNQWVDRRIREVDLPRLRGTAADQLRQRQAKNLVRLFGTPTRGVGQKLHPKVGEAIAQAVADTGGVIVYVRYSANAFSGVLPSSALRFQSVSKVRLASV